MLQFKVVDATAISEEIEDDQGEAMNTATQWTIKKEFISRDEEGGTEEIVFEKSKPHIIASFMRLQVSGRPSIGELIVCQKLNGWEVQ